MRRAPRSGARAAPTARAIAWLLPAALALVAACGAPPGEPAEGSMQIGDYRLEPTSEGLEVRSIPDQWEWLNRLVGWIHPGAERVGLPAVRASASGLVEWGRFGGTSEVPRERIARIVVARRLPRGVEAKTQLLQRTWRVVVMSPDGTPLRGFGFADEGAARAFAIELGRALGVVPTPGIEEVPGDTAA